MGKRKSAKQFLSEVDSFALGNIYELDIASEFSGKRERQIACGLIDRICALASVLREKQIKLHYGSSPGRSIDRKKRRKEQFRAAYQQYKSGRTHRGAVLLAMEAAGIKAERTAWSYVAELGLKVSGK